MLRFRRITTQKQFIPQIDGLRFVAITSVVLFHIYAALERGAVPPPFPLTIDPKHGVELFFVISGFILGVPFASRYLLATPKVNLKLYFLRRLTRLEPPYFLALAASAAMQRIVAHRSLSDMAPHLVAHSTYQQNIMFGAFVNSVMPVAWSLEIEIQFYLLAPFLAIVFSIGDARLRRIVISFAILILGLLNAPLFRSTHLHYSILYYGAFFLAGFLLCDLYVTRGEWRRSFAWDALAICLWPFVWLMGRDVSHVVLPFLAVVLYLSAFRSRIFSAIFSHPVVTDIGGMCYSIYLFHFLVIYGVKHLTAPLHFGTNFWIYYILQSFFILPIVLLVCGGFFVLIERPCMDREWPRKLWNQMLILAFSGSEQPQS